MAAGVFISFRPDDAAWAKRIRDRLGSLLGPRLVVWKHNDLGRGVRFANALVTRAREVEAVVLIIGRNWLAGMVDDPSDRVRIEIEATLDRKIRVIPVLVDGASMPSADALPESLKILARLEPNSGIAQLAKTQPHPGAMHSFVPSINLPFARSDLRVTGLKRIAGRPQKMTTRKSSANRKAARKAAATKTAARKTVTKKAVRKVAATKRAEKETATKTTAGKKTAAKKATAKRAARPNRDTGEVASGQSRGAVNQDLSIDEMKRFTSARRAEVPPDEDDPISLGAGESPPPQNSLVRPGLKRSSASKRTASKKSARAPARIGLHPAGPGAVSSRGTAARAKPKPRTSKSTTGTIRTNQRFDRRDC